MNKKSIGALLLSFALLVGASGGTYAYFTDTTNTDMQSITLGNLQVRFQPASGNQDWWVIARSVPNYTEAFNIDRRSGRDLINDNGYDEISRLDGTGNYNKNYISNVAPGDLLMKTFTLKNTGSLDAKIKLSLADLQIVGGDQTGTLLPDHNYLFKAYTLNADGTPGDEVLVVADADHPGSFILDAKRQEEIVVYSYVYLDSSINNGGMNKNLQFDVKVNATQWNNSGWDQ